MKCCLGFYALAIGYTENEIVGQLTPSDLVLTRSEPDPALLFLLDDSDADSNSKVAHVLMNLNDAPLQSPIAVGTGDHAFSIEPLQSEQDRENRIAAIFATQGIAVEFVD
jgi:hypothetical protein